MSQSIDKFLANIKNKNTRRRYKHGIEQFFKYLGKDPDKYVKSIKKADFERDIWKFITYLDEDRKLAPKTIKLFISIIKNFCIMNEMGIPERIFVTIRRRTPKALPQIQDAVPTKKILREIFQYVDFKTKCIATFMLSSGMRIGEVLGLTKDDIEMDFRGYVKVNIPRDIAKGKYARITFVSSEGKELLEQWLSKERRIYLEQARHKTNFEGKKKVSLRDKRLFPMWDSTVRVSWIGALTRSGHNDRCPNTGTYKYHLHTLRKFFKTNLSGHINQNALDIMIGHTNELDRTYTDLTFEDKINELYNEYKKGEGRISVYTSGVSEGQVANLELELKKRDKQLGAMSTRFERFLHLQREKARLENKLREGHIDIGKGEDVELEKRIAEIEQELLAL